MYIYIYITTYIFIHQYVSLHIIIDHYASSYTISQGLRSFSSFPVWCQNWGDTLYHLGTSKVNCIKARICSAAHRWWISLDAFPATWFTMINMPKSSKVHQVHLVTGGHGFWLSLQAYASLCIQGAGIKGVVPVVRAIPVISKMNWVHAQSLHWWRCIIASASHPIAFIRMYRNVLTCLETYCNVLKCHTVSNIIVPAVPNIGNELPVLQNLNQLLCNCDCICAAKKRRKSPTSWLERQGCGSRGSPQTITNHHVRRRGGCPNLILFCTHSCRPLSCLASWLVGGAVMSLCAFSCSTHSCRPLSCLASWLVGEQ